MSVKQIEAMFGASIKFVPDLSNAAYSMYEVKALNCPVPLFDIKVSNLTGEIYVNFPDTTVIELDIKAKLKSDMTPDGVTTRPSSDSVKKIVYPRIIGLLADKISA